MIEKYILANVRDQVSPLASGATPCASKDRDRSAEGMGINCIALLAYFNSLELLMLGFCVGYASLMIGYWIMKKIEARRSLYRAKPKKRMKLLP